MAKKNQLAGTCTTIAQKQLELSTDNKRPRIRAVQKYRALYNNARRPQLRVRYDAPLPVFAGMVDTLQADLNDSVRFRYGAADPADYLAVKKANAAVDKLANSPLPMKKWDYKFRMARQECVFTGRGILKYSPYSNEDGEYNSRLESVTFDDFHFEPKGGAELEDHLFCGQTSIWKTKKDLEDGAAAGIYDKQQVEELLNTKGDSFDKTKGFLEPDEEGRFRPLGLAPDNYAWVGEPTYRLVEWVMTHDGRRWYILFEYITGIWIRFEKLTDIHSSGLLPWFSFASHPDAKNFASKGFADDLYPHAVSIVDLFNEDMENRRLRAAVTTAVDKEIFPDLQKFYEAQTGRRRIIHADTKNGTRRISEGLYTFQTPELTGTVDLIGWLERSLGKHLNVNSLQQGAAQPATKKVGVAYAEMAQISKRISFDSQPIVDATAELGLRVFGGMKDYLREPMSIKILGENGFEFTELTRIDLNVKKDFEISVTSESSANLKNATERRTREGAIARNRQNPNVNQRILTEYDFRNSGYPDEEITMLMDTSLATTNDSIAVTSQAIQELMKGKMPKINYRADSYFLERILEYVETHADDRRVIKNQKLFFEYLDKHERIAERNSIRRAKDEARRARRGLPEEEKSEKKEGAGEGIMPRVPAQEEELDAPEMPGGRPSEIPIAA